MINYFTIKIVFKRGLLCWVIVLLITTQLQGQQARSVVIASAGSNSTAIAGHTIESTVGETVIATAGSGPMCTQGMHQPNAVQVDFAADNGFVLVYPNPVQTNLHVKLYIEERTSVTFTLYTTTGQQLLARSRELIPGYHQELIPVTGLKSGIYMLIIRESVSGRKFSVKVLKQ